MEESWFERSKEKGNTVLEKLRNWWCIIGLRTLGFFFFFVNFFYYIILIWHQNNTVLRLTLILISVPKLHRFGISLKKKNLNYNISILNPKIIRYPTSPSPINVSSLPLCFCLLTLYLCCYCRLMPQFLEFHFFLSPFCYSQEVFYRRFWILCSSLQCFHWGWFMYFIFYSFNLSFMDLV